MANDSLKTGDASLDDKITKLQNQEGMLEPQVQDNSKYNPSKRLRAIRRQVYTRYYLIRDDPNRIEAEADWEIADKEFGMVTEEIDPDDWRSHLELPDAFSAIQTQSQETIERKARPVLVGTEESDEPIEQFANEVINYNMSNTGFDYQAFLSKLSASIRGTAFRMDYWRTDKRTVKYPDSLNDDGTIKYVSKEIIDFDDDFTEWVPNEFIYIDEKAKHIDEAVDMFRREILNIDEFHRIYDTKPGFVDAQYVTAGGTDRSNRSWFRLPKDITEQDVEVLHYYNRSIDAYWCVANNVTIYDAPLPSKHKELPIAVDYQYRVPGRFWGMGIPKIMHMLSEERKAIRRLNLDRQKLQINKSFLHNSSYDIDDDDLVTRPNGLISVDTNGGDIRQSLVPLEYGDIAPSYFRTEEILLQDMRRATGIEDRLEANAAGTATEAAIKKEAVLKRVNLISISNEMDSVIRLGRLKWSNIQFFYGIPRMEKITEDNEEREEKVHRNISVQGKKFAIKNENGKKALSMEDVKGSTALTLKPEYAKYLEGSFDISVDADIFTPVSKAIEQTKKTEMFSLMLSNPATLSVMDINGAVADVLKVNNINPEIWMKNAEGGKKDMMMLAESENLVMSAGQPLSGTEGATEDHTLVHLIYTKSGEFQQLPHEIQQIIMDHILQEHDANPATGSAGDLMGAYGLTPNPAQQGAQAGSIAPLAVGAGSTSQPQAQVADLQPTNFANPE